MTQNEVVRHPPPRSIGSVVIPAHNEAAVIRRCLDALLTGIEPHELEVVVACNGCTDATAELARSSGHAVRVVELATASKAAALRAGDDVAVAFPRVYLDADVVLRGSAVRLVMERLRSGAIAARPPIEYDTTHSSPLVRGYYRARSRIPAVMRSLYGAGVYGLSEVGRSRFDAFPDVVSDDLWVDTHFEADEVEVVDCRPVLVVVPRHARALLRVLARTGGRPIALRRTYRAKAEKVPTYTFERTLRNTTATTLRDLGRLVATGPASALDAAVYSAFALMAQLRLLLGPMSGIGWGRDDSSRAA
jgi:glycosyltransferase involved in cell wall biosynthesis